MTFRAKISEALFPLLAAFFLSGFHPASADPSRNVTPDQPLYQKVKSLEAYGLLDPRDRSVLDKGRVVTRLELAFYVEKAKRKLLEEETVAAPKNSQDRPTPLPAAVAAADVQAKPTVPRAAPSRPALASEIDTLLRQLDQEAVYLTTRLALDDYRLRQQEDELRKLNDAEDRINVSFRRSNKSSTDPHFTTAADVRVENLAVSGITQVSATAVKNEVNLGVWSGLGGEGSFSMGLNTALYSSAANTPSQPATLYLFSPAVNFNLDGMLGHWNNTVAVEDYTSDVDLGDFTRGAAPGALRYEDPFDIKKYSSDKNMKNWDDYMSNLGYVPSYTAWSNQNNSSRVFDGLYMLGSGLPLVSRDAKMTLLVGKPGTSGMSQRWEEGIKYSQSWPGGIQTSLSSLWVNDNFGVAPAGQPVLDLRSYAANVGVDLRPFFLDLEGGFSSLSTGYFSSASAAVTSFQPNTSEPHALEAPAGQASLSFYPLTLYYTAISDGYANFQSKVMLTGIQFWKFGYYNGYPAAPYLLNGMTMNDQFGFVGMVDDLISDRYGWRLNLGWKGRQESWTQFLPSFLDDVVVNFDAAQKTEYTAVADETGYYDLEPYNLISVYYPDDTGLFGGSVWDGFGGIHPGGQRYVDNIETLRNDANWSGSATTDYAYVLRFSGLDSERVPLILPVSAPVTAGGRPLPAGSRPVTGTDGHNLYLNLDNLKTFNYLTLTAKLQFHKLFNMAQPLYGSVFFTDHQVSGRGGNPALASLADPYRPGHSLAEIPDLFDQRVFDGALLYGVVKNLNLLADYGLETWKSDYTYPRVDYRTTSLGVGLAYDLPWGGGKLEFRYKHLDFQDRYVPANDYQADQYYSYFLFEF